MAKDLDDLFDDFDDFDDIGDDVVARPQQPQPQQTQPQQGNQMSLAQQMQAVQAQQQSYAPVGNNSGMSPAEATATRVNAKHGNNSKRGKRRADDDESSDEPVKTRSTTMFVVSLAATALVSIIITFIAASFILSGNKNAGDAPKPVESVKQHSQVIDDLETIKDSQIQSLNQKIQDLTLKTGMSPTETLAVQSQLAAQASKDLETIDTIIGQVYALPPDADKGNVDAVRSSIVQYMTESAASTVGYDFVNGSLPAKMLNQEGRVSSSSTLMPVSIGSKYATYLVVSAFTTDSGTPHAATLVTFTNTGSSGSGERKVSFIKFIGILTDFQVGAFEDAIAEADRTVTSSGLKDADQTPSDAASKQPQQPKQQPKPQPTPSGK